MSPAINQHKQATMGATFHVGFFLGFPINSEDARDMFLQSVVYFQQITWRYIAGDRTLHNHRCEALTFFNSVIHSLIVRFKCIVIVHIVYIVQYTFI
jgi:hypothetical protein